MQPNRSPFPYNVSYRVQVQSTSTRLVLIYNNKSDDLVNFEFSLPEHNYSSLQPLLRLQGSPKY